MIRAHHARLWEWWSAAPILAVTMAWNTGWSVPRDEEDLGKTRYLKCIACALRVCPTRLIQIDTHTCSPTFLLRYPQLPLHSFVTTLRGIAMWPLSFFLSFSLRSRRFPLYAIICA